MTVEKAPREQRNGRTCREEQDPCGPFQARVKLMVFLPVFYLCIKFSREEMHSIVCHGDITLGTQLVHNEVDAVLKFCCVVLP